MESVIEKLHKERLAEKNIVIEDMFSRHGEILVRSTDGQRNDNVVNCPRIEKRYFHNNKFIYAEKKFDKNATYTFFFGNDEAPLSCPNCGHNGKVKEFINGCPFCKTNFNIDYTNKSYNSIKIFELITSKQFIRAVVIFTLILWFALNFSRITNPTFFMDIIFAILLFPVTLLISYFCITLCCLPILLFQMIMNTVLQKFNINGENMTKSLFNSLIPELIDYYYDEKRAPQYKDLIDFDILGCNKFFFSTNLATQQTEVIINYTIRKIYFSNNKIKKKISKNEVKLKRNNNIQDLLKNGYKVIPCENCGASIEITADECEYCRTPIKFKNEWTIEEFM